MKTYGFTLILAGVWDDLTDDMMGKFLGAGCDDGTPGLCEHRLSVIFSREADSAEEAILSAIRDVRAAGFDVERIAEADPMSQLEMADRMGKSKQYVHQLVNGGKGPGTFPPPVTPGRWSWPVVSDWLADNGLADSGLAECAKAAAVVNAALIRKEAAEESPELLALVEAGV